MHRNLLRPVRPVFRPCIYHDPVYFPGLAPIIRERLFKTAGSWGDVRNNKSNQDGAAIERILVEELSSSIFELADRWWVQGAFVDVGKI